jgi:hypothetical protein
MVVLKMAFRNISRQKRRTFFTGLSIIGGFTLAVSLDRLTRLISSSAGDMRHPYSLMNDLILRPATDGGNLPGMPRPTRRRGSDGGKGKMAATQAFRPDHRSRRVCNFPKNSKPP